MTRRKPPVRSGELLRHLANPRDTKTMLTVLRVVLIAGAAWAVMVGFMAALPFSSERRVVAPGSRG